MPKELRTYTEKEAECFRRLFESVEYRTNQLYQSIAEKMYRHEYCLVGHDLTTTVMEWMKRCGLNVRIAGKNGLFTEIELV
jgi:hypothetical protein